MLVFTDGAAFQRLWIIYSCSFESKWPQPLLTLVTLHMHIYICLHMDVTEFSNLPECRLVLKRLPGESTSELGTSSGTT